MTNRDISINVAGNDLTTNATPGGIDLTKLNENEKKLLSVFDSNGDNKLSQAEINQAILKFDSVDKTRTESVEKGDQIISTTTKKNNKLEDVELKNLHIKNPGQGKKAMEVAEIKEAAKLLYREQLKSNLMKEQGFEATYDANWLKDKEGNHYLYDGKSFVKSTNVCFVGKDGSIKTKFKSRDNRYVIAEFNKDGVCVSLQLRSADLKHIYADPTFVSGEVHKEIVLPRTESSLSSALPPDIICAKLSDDDKYVFFQKPGKDWYKWNPKQSRYELHYNAAYYRRMKEVVCNPEALRDYKDFYNNENTIYVE